MRTFVPTLMLKLHHLDDALSVVLREIERLAVGSRTQAWLEARGPLVKGEDA